MYVKHLEQYLDRKCYALFAIVIFQSDKLSQFPTGFPDTFQKNIAILMWKYVSHETQKNGL